MRSGFPKKTQLKTHFSKIRLKNRNSKIFLGSFKKKKQIFLEPSHILGGVHHWFPYLREQGHCPLQNLIVIFFKPKRMSQSIALLFGWANSPFACRSAQYDKLTDPLCLNWTYRMLGLNFLCFWHLCINGKSAGNSNLTFL